jgi:gliding motility-associated-like protein
LILNATSAGATGYLWNTGDTDSIIVVYSSGNYSVDVNYANCSFQDSISVQFNDYPIVDLGNDTILCEGSILTLDASSSLGTSYLWQDGSTNSWYDVNQTGIYKVNVFNGTCVFTDSIEVSYVATPLVNIGNDTTLCVGESLLLDATTTGAIGYLWQDGSAFSTFNVIDSGIYFVQVNFNQCTITDTIVVDYNSYPSFDLGLDTILCDGENLELNAFSPLATDYLWQNGSTNSSIIVNVSGVYFAVVNNGNCITRDSIEVSFLSIPEIDLGNDTILCDVTTLILDASNTNADSYTWNTAETTPTIFVNVSGIYNVTVNNNRCVFYDTISVDFGVSPEVYLGNDTSLCDGQTLLLDANSPNVISYSWQDGSNFSTYSVMNEGIYSVEVSNSLCATIDSIVINYNRIPIVNLGNDTVFCGVTSIELNSGVSSSGFAQWQDGSIVPNYFVDTSGIYSVNVIEDGCSNSDQVEIILEQYPSLNLGGDTNLCTGDTLILNVGTEPRTTYLWQDGSTNSEYLVSASGVYSVSLSNNICEVTDEIEIDFDVFPSFELPSDTFLCNGSFLEFGFPNSGENNNYLWQDGTTSSNYTVLSEGTYILNVSNSCGSNSDSIFVDYYSCKCEFKAPNVFTPNFDNDNDVFGVFPLCDSLESIELEIYNRWGELVFTSNSVNSKWDGILNGTTLPMDNYVWYLRYTWREFGEIKEEDVSGNIFLMR